MGKVVNDGLPEPIFLAVQNDKYDAGQSDYTPSSLNAPAYQRALQRENRDRIVEEASGRIWALLGSAVHYMIELAGEKAKAQYECERRFYGQLDTRWGVKVIGSQVDILKNGSPSGIYDMKTTSVYQAKKDAKDEWVSQLNVGRWCIYKETGLLVDFLSVVGIWRDWRARDVGSHPDYPPKQVSEIPLNVWSLEKTENWMRERIAEHEICSELSLEDRHPCSEKEVWANPTKYAVKKPGAYKASKVCDTEAEALEALKPGQMIEVRPGTRKRCENYCSAANICPAWLAHRMKYGI